MNPNSSACFTVSKPRWYSAIKDGAKQLMLVVFSTLHTCTGSTHTGENVIEKLSGRCCTETIDTIWNDSLSPFKWKKSCNSVIQNKPRRLRIAAICLFTCFYNLFQPVFSNLKCDPNWNTSVATWTLRGAHQPYNWPIKAKCFSQNRIYFLSLNPSLL